jgi:hypothetical protein
MWEGGGLTAWDPKNPKLVEQEQQMTAKVRAMAAQYGDSQCGLH